REVSDAKELPSANFQLLGMNLFRSAADDAGLSHLDGLTGLTTLVLNSTRVTDDGLAKLEGLTGLTSLDLANVPVTDRGLAHLSGLTNLQTVDLNDTKVTGTGLDHLRALPRLEVLIINVASDADLAHVKALKGLRNLYAGGANMGDAGLANLEGAV